MLQMDSSQICANLLELMDSALFEDDAASDLTSGALPLTGVAAEGVLLIKSPGVLAGTNALARLRELRWLAESPFAGEKLEVELLCPDGTHFPKGTVAARIRASADLLLRLERSMLNLLSHLSGVATLTRRFVDAVSGTSAQICDTRKTLVGLRMAQKYAVVCGGGTNHRFSLGDEAMIKENHLALSGLSIEDAIKAIRAKGSQRLTCECESLGQVESAMAAGADCVLLDNFSLQSLRQAVSLRRALGRTDVPFEASGGVNLNTVAEIAATGVERISIGALTHSAPSLDISFKIHRR